MVHSTLIQLLSVRVDEFRINFRYGEQAGRVTGDAMGAVANAVEVLYF